MGTQELSDQELNSLARCCCEKTHSIGMKFEMCSQCLLIKKGLSSLNEKLEELNSLHGWQKYPDRMGQ